jgi:DNA gyrase subunit A
MIGTGISKFLNDVANLVETKKTTDIVDISNQSSKEGIRIVLELKKGADVENLKNMLYKKTRLEDTFGVNMLAVADGRPETLGLKKIIEHHVDFQFELATRKYQTLLAKEKEKSEVQEGLIKACDVIDLIIEILRGSKSVKDARACLVNGVTDNIKFKSSISKKMAAMLRFTERQATAILEMRLYRLIGLEIEALRAEHEQTLKNIARFEDILNNYDSMAGVIIEELDGFKKEYARKRRTVIENAEEAVYEEKKIEEQEVVFLMDRFGYAKTVDISVYERNKEAADSENKYVVRCMNTGKLCVFTDSGRMHQVKVLDVPYGRFRDKGTPIDNVSNYSTSDEQIIMVCDAEQMRYAYLLFATAQGMIKKVEGTEFQVTKRTIAATKLQDGDSLIAVKVVNDSQHTVLQTRNGYFLRFPAADIPVKKKAAVGVRGIRLQKKDELENVYLFEEGTETKIHYNEKEVTLNRLKQAKRDGAGTKYKG